MLVPGKETDVLKLDVEYSSADDAVACHCFEEELAQIL